MTLTNEYSNFTKNWKLNPHDFDAYMINQHHTNRCLKCLEYKYNHKLIRISIKVSGNSYFDYQIALTADDFAYFGKY